MLNLPPLPAMTSPLPSQQPMEIRKLLLKLRWIGMNEEADRLASELARFAPGVTIAGSYETD
jgi:hypothetical protein